MATDIEDLFVGIEKSIREWEIISVETYIGNQLTDYINGGAALFYAYNFKDLVVRKYESEEYDLTIEVYEFDTSENAFGIYSFDTDGEHPQIGHEATYAYGLLRFWKDVYFVRIFASYENEVIKTLISDLGKQVAHNIVQLGSKPALVSRVPDKNVLDGRIHYFHEEICLNNIYYIGDENPLNLNANTDAITYEYDLEVQASRVILVLYKEQGHAEAAAKKFAEVYCDQHSVDAPNSMNETTIMMNNANEKFLCVKQIGNYLIVVIEADSEDSCKRVLEVQEALL